MAERHRRYLAEAAELSMSLGRRMHERAMEARSQEEADRAALGFQRAMRSMRQCLALEKRFEREDALSAREAARHAEETRRARADARRKQVSATVSRLIWNEAERDEISGLLVDLKRVLDSEVFDEAFLEGPVDELVDRLCQEIGLMAEAWDVEEEEEPEPSDPSPLAGSEASRADPSGYPSRQRFGEAARPDGGLPEEGRMRGLSDPSSDAQPFSIPSG